MLHWSQEASTGWTRNSWGCSMAKRACLSLMTGLGRERRIGTGRRTESTIRPPAHARCAIRVGPLPARPASARSSRVDAAHARSYAGSSGSAPKAEEHGLQERGSVTSSEFSFLALGLILGLVTGAALVELFRARPPSPHEVRLTVSHNAIPGRSSTLAEDAFIAVGPEPARGGPADRRLTGAPAASGAAERRTNLRYEWPSPPLHRPSMAGAIPIGPRPAGAALRPGRIMAPSLPLTGIPPERSSGPDAQLVGIPISGGNDPVLGPLRTAPPLAPA